MRLIYECNPWAFIFEAAGGKATNGKIRIQEMPFKSLHQRTPLFIGNRSMMEEVQTFFERNGDSGMAAYEK